MKKLPTEYTTSPEGLAFLAGHEGIVPGPYRDSEGVWTYGIGHTAKAGLPDPAHMPRGMPPEIEPDIDEAITLFKADVRKYEDRVKRAVKVPVAQHEFDALVSFDYNTGGIFEAKLTEHLNSGDRQEAAKAFMGWLKPPSVKNRRTEEKHLFESGVYPNRRINVWPVDESGHVTYIARSHMMPGDFIRYLEKGAPRQSITESGTMRAIVGTVATAAPGTVAAIATLEGWTQRIVIISAFATCVMLLWLARRRIKEWAEGDR